MTRENIIGVGLKGLKQGKTIRKGNRMKRGGGRWHGLKRIEISLRGNMITRNKIEIGSKWMKRGKIIKNCN